MRSDPDMTIGQVAARAGIAASSIRYYESVGVLPEPIRVSGQRRYDEDVLRRLEVIDVAQRAGFSLDDIRALFASSERETAAEQLQALANRKLPQVEALIARAEAMKSWLEVAKDCPCSTLEICALFENPNHEVVVGN